jgi:hypothetical protein
VDAGDFDNDGDKDLFMTELTGEGSNLYQRRAGNFVDRRLAPGPRPGTVTSTGFGTVARFDNDSWLDLPS